MSKIMWDTDDVQDARGPGRMALGHWDLELSRVSVMHSQVKRNKCSIFGKVGMAHSWKLASGFRKFIFIEISLAVFGCAVQWEPWPSVTWSPRYLE